MGNKNKFVLIYQMGKVASSSVRHSLLKAGYKVWVPHTLRGVFLNKLFNYRPIYKFVGIKGRYKQLHECLYNIYKSKVVGRNNPLKIISMVREPIGRNMSMFFHVFHISLAHVMSSKDTRITTKATMNNIIDEFFNSFNQEHVLDWFDNEINKYYGIDVYDHAFDTKKGFTVIKQKNIELLVLKFETLEEHGWKAIREFLNDDSIEPFSINEADQKWYSCLYKEFKSKIEFTDEYLEKMLESKYVKHFYSDDEIKGMYEKYRRQD